MMTLVLLMILPGQALRPIPYCDPLGRTPSSYADYAATQSNAPFQARVVCRSAVDGRYDNLVLVFVNASLYSAIPTELATYLSDVAADGYQTKTIATSGGRAQNLRQILQAHRDSGLIGSVMIGDLPVAWWTEGSSGEDFPIDIFFEDLTGTFADANSDGRYDSYSYTGPTVWVGRIYASRMTYGSEVQLIRSYFQRNHMYRTGGLMIPHRGLVYNEVTWYPNDHGMSNLFTNVTTFNDANTTTAYHYKNQLRSGYEFVHAIIHSSPWVHTFFLNGDVPGGGSLFNFEIPALAPNAAFYFINGCMCGRYTERDCLCNWYLFAEPWAQAVVASSQLMYGLSDISQFYQAFGRDSCFGASFLAWYRSDFSSFMGTLILGDPTLRLNRSDHPVARIAPASRPASAPLDWTEYVIDTTNFVNGRPRLGQSQGRIRIVFDSGRIVRSDNYMTSFDGTRFTRPESIAWHDYYDVFSSCCTDSAGRFWVVWQSFRDYDAGYGHFQLFSSYYYNNTWSSVNRVGPLAGYHDVQPALACGTDNTVWCAFKSWRNGRGDIWVSSEQNGGAWAAPTRLTTDSLDQIEPCIAVDHNNHPWVFWSSFANGRWRIQGRTYNGTWQPAFDLDTIGSGGPPRATVDGEGRIWVVWHKWSGSQSDVLYSCYADSNWSSPAPVTTDPADDILPDITTAPDGTVWLCWMSKATGFWDIVTSHYAGGWTTPDPVTNDNANDYDPTIGADADGNIWTSWASDRRGYWNIYAAMAAPTGATEKFYPAAIPATTVRVTPNPFSREVAFLGAPGLTVSVYALDGRRVAKLAAPTGRACWSPGELTNGVYLARISADGKASESVIKLIRMP